MPKKADVELIENFLVVWNPAEGSELYQEGFYGKPLGIAKPKTPEFNVPLVLDLMEGLYLAEKGMITVHESPEKKKVGLRKLRQVAKQLYEEFNEKYIVYRDLRNSGLVVTPGIKFGCDFAVYKHGPGILHGFCQTGKVRDDRNRSC
jgi:tRNA-intron endonuclease